MLGQKFALVHGIERKKMETRRKRKLNNNMDVMNTIQLFTSVSNGDHLGVKKALIQGADPNTCMPYSLGKWGDYEKLPMLTVASHEGHFDVVCALLAPLAQAVREGNMKIAEKLINHGADVKSSCLPE